jgi:hypothetical protein
MLSRIHLLAFAGVTISGLTVLVNCVADPREDEPDQPVPECDVAILSKDPANPQSTLAAYVTATQTLKTQSEGLETALKDACNALNADLGYPAGADALGACKRVNDRILALNDLGINKGLGTPPPGQPVWAEQRFAYACVPEPNALATCMATCAPGCDVSKCDPKATAGKCAGTCTGACKTTGDAIACTGSCVGQVPVGPPLTCNGQCQGGCTNPAYAGDRLRLSVRWQVHGHLLGKVRRH